MDRILKKYTNRYSRFVVIRSALVHFRDEGPKDAPVIVCLHGAFSSLQTFDGWCELLKKDYRIIRFDLPGFGLTGPILTNRYSIRKSALYLHGLLEILDVDQVHLVGNSLGGWVAWQFALEFPSLVNKLILIDSAGFLDSESIPLPFKLARNKVFSNIMKIAMNRTIIEKYVHEVYANPKKLTEEVVDRYYDLFTRKGNPEAFIQMANSNFIENSAELVNIKHDTLVLWGKQDKWIPVEKAAEFKKLMPNCKVKIYADLGHVPMEENPKKTYKDLIKFLKP